MQRIRSGQGLGAFIARLTLLAGAACYPAHAAPNCLADVTILPGTDRTASQLALQLELIVNGVASGQVVPVWLDGGHYSIMRTDIEAAGIRLPEVAGEKVSLDTLPGAQVVYDEPGQRLNIIVPLGWLPHRAINMPGLVRTRPISNFGLLLNYDANIVIQNGEPHASAWGEARLFGGFGRISLTGVVQRGHLMRYDLSWVRSDDERMVTLEAGDFVTRNLVGNRAVRMGGIQISRDFWVRPDVITYPLPAFAGQAALPSTVELLIDGYRATTANVGPGNFTVGAIPGLNGAGQATLAITDVLGRRQTTTMPFYVANDLLQPGFLDYSFAAGALRQDYGLRSFSYGAAAGIAAVRYGLNAFMTAEGSLEAGAGRFNASLGGLVQLGLLGVANTNFAISNAHGRAGWRWTFGYQYRTRRIGLALSHVRESHDFADMGDLHLAQDRRHVTTAAASLSTEAFGSFGLSYVEGASGPRNKASLASASWSLPVGRGVVIYGSGTYDLRQPGWTAALNLVLPFGGRRGTAAVGVTRDNGGGRVERFDYGRAVPSEGGLGGSVSLAQSSAAGVFGSGEVDWRAPSFDLRGGAFGERGSVTPWGAMSGALVLMDGALIAANRIADAFVLISTDGQSGIPVTYENQRAGRTGHSGHLLIPWVPSYYAARYAIDPLVLPAEMVVPKVEDRLSVTRGSGAVLRFPVSAQRMGRVTLVDRAGAYLPVGALASVNGGEPQVIGWDGLLFLPDMQDHNLISVNLPDGTRCIARLAASSDYSGAGEDAPVKCQ